VRLALLTTTVLMRVDDEEQAASIAIETEKQGRLHLEHVLEMHNASHADLEGGLAMLGTSVTMLPEEMVEA
jgi:hypothetical protein